LPELDASASSILSTVLRFAALRNGVKLALPSSGNPLAGVDGATLGKLLAVRCVSCSQSELARVG
jgi:hypothetical protein